MRCHTLRRWTRAATARARAAPALPVGLIGVEEGGALARSDGGRLGAPPQPALEPGQVLEARSLGQNGVPRAAVEVQQDEDVAGRPARSPRAAGSRAGGRRDRAPGRAPRGPTRPQPARGPVGAVGQELGSLNAWRRSWAFGAWTVPNSRSHRARRSEVARTSTGVATCSPRLEQLVPQASLGEGALGTREAAPAQAAQEPTALVRPHHHRATGMLQEADPGPPPRRERRARREAQAASRARSPPTSRARTTEPPTGRGPRSIRPALGPGPVVSQSSPTPKPASPLAGASSLAVLDSVEASVRRSRLGRGSGAGSAAAWDGAGAGASAARPSAEAVQPRPGTHPQATFGRRLLLREPVRAPRCARRALAAAPLRRLRLVDLVDGLGLGALTLEALGVLEAVVVPVGPSSAASASASTAAASIATAVATTPATRPRRRSSSRSSPSSYSSISSM